MANFDLNKVILGGRLVADPELKQTQSGVFICTFRLAIKRKYANDQADFIDCTAWRNQAEFLCQYFRKGSSVCVVGSIQTRSWSDQNGQRRYATEVVADEISFVDSKSDSRQPAYNNSAPAFEAPQDSGDGDQSDGFVEVSNDSDLPF